MIALGFRYRLLPPHFKKNLLVPYPMPPDRKGFQYVEVHLFFV